MLPRLARSLAGTIGCATVRPPAEIVRHIEEEYRVISPKLSPNGIIPGDDANVTGKLAREKGRHFLFLREDSSGHWYPGMGIGISFP